MQVEGESSAAKAEQVTRQRPAVERLLTWSGLIPLPVFLCLHLAREAALSAAGDVSEVVRSAPSSFERLSLLLLVWAPLLLHVGLGGWLLSSSRPRETRAGLVDVPALPLGLSRASGLLSLVFLVYHARLFPLAVWLGEADARDAGFRLIDELSSLSFGVPLRGGAYLLGLLATVTHAGLGVHRGLLLEGLLVSDARRRLSARCCAALGALCFGVGAAAVIRVATGVLVR
jgi:succinate dehydrogenase/fumarate reductase cytochrome b subunit